MLAPIILPLKIRILYVRQEQLNDAGVCVGVAVFVGVGVGVVGVFVGVRVFVGVFVMVGVGVLVGVGVGVGVGIQSPSIVQLEPGPTQVLKPSAGPILSK
jgi:hypothetical protein